MNILIFSGSSTITEYKNEKIVGQQSFMFIPMSVYNGRKDSFISSINYQNNLLFLTKEDVQYILYKRPIVGKKLAGKNVFSVSIGNHTIQNLKNPVQLLFRNVTDTEKTTCGFWKFQPSTYFSFCESLQSCE